jgi:hypothetical protein
VKCPVCDGIGGFYEDYGEGPILMEKCTYCHKGQLGLLKWLSYHFWQNAPDWLWSVVDFYWELRGEHDTE